MATRDLEKGRALRVDPPIFNSASPWATTKEELQELYDCPYTGAVTTRTSLIDGFAHDDGKHQYIFFDIGEGNAPSAPALNEEDLSREPRIPRSATSSLNTLGYSPHPLAYYITAVTDIVSSSGPSARRKPFIFSVTGTSGQIVAAYGEVCQVAASTQHPVAIEVNLSCPNIDGKPPPAYNGDSLAEYLGIFVLMREKISEVGLEPVPIGIKTPPYTHMGQFTILVAALATLSTPDLPVVDFITATNTLGSCLVLEEHVLTPAVSSEAGTGIGGLAGSALHPLALGNVKTLRLLLDQRPELERVMIIGVGGVSDGRGYKRMRHVGADAVALATALGREGVKVFEGIHKGAFGDPDLIQL